MAATSSPSMNFTPWMIFGNWLWPSRRRQLFCAPSTSLNTMASVVLFERHPFDRMVLCRTVAKVLAMGFVTGMKIGGAFLSGWDRDEFPAYGTTIRESGTGSTKCGQADIVR